MEEERRLKALLDIEKTKAHRKADRLAAARAERQRKSAKSEYRRAANKEVRGCESRSDEFRKRVSKFPNMKESVSASAFNVIFLTR